MTYQTFNISLPKELVAKADKRAKKEFKNRSELIREALRLYMLSPTDDFLELSQKWAQYVIDLEPGEGDDDNINYKNAKPINRNDFL